MRTWRNAAMGMALMGLVGAGAATQPSGGVAGDRVGQLEQEVKDLREANAELERQVAELKAEKEKLEGRGQWPQTAPSVPQWPWTPRVPSAPEPRWRKIPQVPQLPEVPPRLPSVPRVIPGVPWGPPRTPRIVPGTPGVPSVPPLPQPGGAVPKGQANTQHYVVPLGSQAAEGGGK